MERPWDYGLSALCGRSALLPATPRKEVKNVVMSDKDCGLGIWEEAKKAKFSEEGSLSVVVIGYRKSE